MYWRCKSSCKYDRFNATDDLLTSVQLLDCLGQKYKFLKNPEICDAIKNETCYLDKMIQSESLLRGVGKKYDI